MTRHSHGYRPKAHLPGWAWFLGGIAVGLALAYAGFLKYRDQLVPEAAVASRDTTTLPAPPVTDPGASPPRFDFYTILPEKEVVVPDQDDKRPVEIKEAREVPDTREAAAAAVKPGPEKKTAAAAKPAAKPASAPPAATAKKGSYVLQVGSFKKMEEADRLRASLALLGIESSVQVVRIGDSDNWHRVRVGPFDNVAQANETRGKLKQNKFNSILLQVKS